jgi:hypothetical protein
MHKRRYNKATILTFKMALSKGGSHLNTKRFERFVQAREFEITYTAAEANSAVSLQNYGIDSYVVSAVPDTELCQACVNFIRQYASLFHWETAVNAYR